MRLLLSHFKTWELVSERRNSVSVRLWREREACSRAVIDERTPGRLLKKKKKAAAHSTDNGNKHIQGAEFRMTYLGKENAFFFPAPTITINLGLMAHPGYIFKYATTQTHPVTQKGRVRTLWSLLHPCL